jgi:hypothetical protein
MQAAKKTVRALLERLPDDCSLEEVLYHLYVIQKVEAGLVDAEAGKLIPHEQVAEELRRKWMKAPRSRLDELRERLARRDPRLHRVGLA